MSQFRKYDHLERYGHSDVADIEIGRVHIFPKMDGSNGSVWVDGPEDDYMAQEIKAASRRRVVSLEADNQEFQVWVNDNADMLWNVFCDEPYWILYGEWMVPHTIKNYRPEVWKKFLVFDVWCRDKGRYVPFEEYDPILRHHGVDVVEPLCIINNPSEDQLQTQVNVNTYFMLDGAGPGEGIVIKNYEWQNRHGRQPWAKIVRNHFKEEARRAHGTTEKDGPYRVECDIAERYCTPELVQKTHAKILVEIANREGICLISGAVEKGEDIFLKSFQENHRKELIPRLLGTIFHEVIQEHAWDFVRKYKNPTVDFKLLQKHCQRLTKLYTPELF